MALQSVEVPVVFKGGVDTKTDPKQVISAKLLALENGIFTATGKIKKRYGQSVRAVTVDAGNPNITNGRGLYRIASELLLADGTTLYDYVAALSKWSIGTQNVLDSPVVRSSAILRAANQPSNPDSAYHATSGLSVYAWEDSTGGVRYSVVDSTGNRVVDNALVSATASRPKLLSLGNYIIILTVDGGQLGYKSILVTAPSTLNAGANFSATLSATFPNYDAAIVNGKIYAAWNKTAAASIAINWLDSSLALGPGLVFTGAPSADGCLCVIDAVGSSQIIVAYSNLAAVLFKVCDYALTTTVASGTLAAADANVTAITGLKPTTGSGKAFWNLGTITRKAFISGVASPYTATNVGNHVRGANLAGKMCTNDAIGGASFVPLAFISSLQNSCFLVTLGGSIIGKLTSEAGLYGAAPSNTLLPETAAVTASKYQMAITVKQSQFAQGGTILSRSGLNGVTFDLNDQTYGFPAAELGGGLHVSGGSLSLYAGSGPVEHGFTLYPEGFTVQTTPFGGSLANGSFAWGCTYEWIDGRGKIHKSAVAEVAAKVDSPRVLINTTNGSLTVGLVTASDANLLVRGMVLIADGLPTGTTITAINNGSVTVNLLATATASNVPATSTAPFYTVTGFSGFNNSNKVIPVRSVPYLFVYGTTVSGSATITMYSSAGLAVGQRLTPYGTAFGASKPKILSLTVLANGGATVVTDTNATATTTTPQCFEVDYLASGTTTSGSPNITGCSAADVTYAAAHVGALAFSANFGSSFTAGSGIVSAAAGTIVMGRNANASGAITDLQIYHDGTTQLAIGQTITADAGLPVGTTISAITANAADMSKSTITLSAYPTAIVTTAGGSFARISTTAGAFLVIPTLRLTSKTATDVKVGVYRTQANGIVFNRVSSATAPLANDNTVDSVSFYDQISDYVANGSDLLYTAGGVLENIPAPPSLGLCAWKGRIWLIDSTNPTTVWYSKECLPGAPVEFNDALTMTVDARGSDLVAVAPLDDKLIFFKDTAIYYTTGNGPNATGGQNDYSAPTQIMTDSGCTDPRSIVKIPSGLMYQSKKGIQLLDRALSVSYIGADVEAYNSETISSAVLVENATQVRFTTSSGKVLMFDYQIGQWSVFNGSTYGTPVAAVSYSGAYNVLRSDGVVAYEDTATYLDNGAFVPMKIQTAWLSFAGIQGFQRLYEMMILGTWYSRHTLTVQISYDFDPTIAQTVTFANTASATPLQLRVMLNRQKCEAIQVTITDSANGALGSGQGFDLSALSFSVGKKRGLSTVPAAQSAG